MKIANNIMTREPVGASDDADQETTAYQYAIDEVAEYINDGFIF